MERKEVLVVLESVGYDLFMEVQPNNIMSLGEVHKAYSHGCWTLPSMIAIWTGHLPTCSIRTCYHHELLQPNPFFMEELTKTRYVYLYTANGWLTPFMYEVRRSGYFPKLYDNHACVQEIISSILSTTVAPFFALTLLTETHTPYNTEKEQTFKDTKDMDELRERQIKALEYLDEQLEPLIKGNFNLIITSDHGENFELGNYGHQLKEFRPKLMEVPLVSRWRKEK